MIGLTLQNTKKALLVLVASAFAFTLIASIFTKPVDASYNGANLIGNSVFLDARSMSSSQIQSFLESKNSGLKSRSYKLDCYGSNSTERQWYTAVGAPCDQTISAARIIYYASQIYGVSPRVVLATLQKEQSLITSPNPTSWQLNNAMGYNCPTSGSCSSPGFYRQIDHGVWALRYHYERANRNNTWWNNNGWTCGSSKSLYKPNLYPGTNVTFYDTNGTAYRTYRLANAATSALYCYTPHAYNNPNGLYGLPRFGTKGLYYSGSYNFVSWFERWFGSTRGYSWAAEMESYTVYTDAERTTEASSPVTSRSGRMLYVTVTARNTGAGTWKNTFVRVGTRSPHNHASVFANDSWMSSARPTALKESSVSPGQIGTFEFTITTPRQDKLYNEQFQIVAEGRAWMSDRSRFDAPVIVSNPYNAALVSRTAYRDPGRTQKIHNSIGTDETVYWRVRAKNTGTNSWSNSNVRIGTTNPYNHSSPFNDDTWLSAARPTNLSESSVAPGAIGTFDYTMTGPSSESISTQSFGILAEGVTWMTGVNYKDNFRVTDNLDRLVRGRRLVIGTDLRSGGYRLIMQGDGNLVVYDPQGRARWNSGTRGGNRFIMQGDGNLVMYNSRNRAIWSSGTKGGNRLIMQGDGSLVVYNSSGKAIWSARK